MYGHKRFSGASALTDSVVNRSKVLADSLPPKVLPPFRAPFELLGFVLMIGCGMLACLVLIGVRISMFWGHRWKNDPAFVVNNAAYYLGGAMIILDGGLIMSYAVDECKKTWHLDAITSNYVMQQLDTHWSSKVTFYTSYVYSLEFWLLKFGFLAYFFPNWRNYGPKMRKYLITVALAVTFSFFALLYLPFLWCMQGSLKMHMSPTRKDGRCLFLEHPRGVLIQAGCNMGTDLMILILAILTYIAPDQDPAERLGGVFIIISAMLQPLLSLNRLQSVYPMTLYPGTHNFSASRAHQIWSCLEAYIALTLNFIPVLRGWMIEYQKLNEKRARREVMIKAIASKDKWRAAVLEYRKKRATKRKGKYKAYHPFRSRTARLGRMAGSNEPRTHTRNRRAGSSIRAPAGSSVRSSLRSNKDDSTNPPGYKQERPPYPFTLDPISRFSVPASSTRAGSEEHRRSSFSGVSSSTCTIRQGPGLVP